MLTPEVARDFPELDVQKNEVCFRHFGVSKTCKVPRDASTVAQAAVLQQGFLSAGKKRLKAVKQYDLILAASCSIFLTIYICVYVSICVIYIYCACMECRPHVLCHKDQHPVMWSKEDLEGTM